MELLLEQNITVSEWRPDIIQFRCFNPSPRHTVLYIIYQPQSLLKIEINISAWICKCRSRSEFKAGPMVVIAVPTASTNTAVAQVGSLVGHQQQLNIPHNSKMLGRRLEINYIGYVSTQGIILPNIQMVAKPITGDSSRNAYKNRLQ